MTITYPLEVPSPNYASIEYFPIDIQSVDESSFTGKTQLQVYPGEYWRASITWAPQHRIEIAEEVTAFLASLRGAFGTFLLRDPLNTTPRGAAAANPSSPVVDGSGQTGPIIRVRNTPASLLGWLLPGARIQVGPNSRCQLCMVLSVTDTTGSNKADIEVWPRIRPGMIDGDAITLNSPAGLFRLDEAFSYTVSAPFRYEHRIICREAF